MSRYFVSTAAFIAVLAATLHAQDAQPAPAINQADTAWMLVSTALVLLMTPALGLRLEYARFAKLPGELTTGVLPENDQVQLGLQFRF